MNAKIDSAVCVHTIIARVYGDASAHICKYMTMLLIPDLVYTLERMIVFTIEHCCDCSYLGSEPDPDFKKLECSTITHIQYMHEVSAIYTKLLYMMHNTTYIDMGVSQITLHVVDNSIHACACDDIFATLRFGKYLECVYYDEHRDAMEASECVPRRLNINIYDLMMNKKI